MAMLAAPPVRLTVDKHFGFAPLDIRARLLIAPHEDTRSACVVVDGPLRTDSSCFPHTKDDLSERVVQFKRLPAGGYTLWAEVRRKDGSTVASAPVTVDVQE